ncbi:MAG: 30S ribosomal protein S27ae [Candidatus Helarchaeota archaeon]
MSVHKYYKITDDGKLIRLNPFCPRCGPGYFMAQNYDRLTCGHCGYTEFKKRTPKKETTSEESKKSSAKAEEPQKGKKKRKKR